MRAWQTSLTVMIWGLALGIWLWGTGFDLVVQVWLAENQVVWLEKTARAVSMAGEGKNQVLVLLALALWWGRGRGWRAQGASFKGAFVQLGLWLTGKWVWCKAWAKLPHRERWVWLAIPVFALAGMVNVALKLVIGRPRPKEWIWNGMNPYDHVPLMDAGFMSLPSGHTASTAAVMTVLALAFPKYWVWFVVAIVLVAVARVLTVTAHYTGDVIAGAAVGFAVAYGVGMAMRRAKV